MEASKIYDSVEHCYFLINGLDMCRGDLENQTNLNSQDEAIAASKKKINFNDNYCCTIFKSKDNRYHNWIKDTSKTNPTLNQAEWFRCKTVFYGKKIISGPQKKMMSEEKLEYFVVTGLNMATQPLFSKECKSFEEALVQLLALIDYDPARCGTIRDERQRNKKWHLYLLQAKKCDPSARKEEQHRRSVSVFLGKEV